MILTIHRIRCNVAFCIQILTTIAMIINFDVVPNKFKTRRICVHNEFLTKVKRIIIITIIIITIIIITIIIITIIIITINEKL